MSFKSVFITGGAGYVGSMLVPNLLKNGYHVTVFDLMIYGEDVLQAHKNLKIVKGDIRNQRLLKTHIPGHEIVIHLACISNDPSFELNPKLGKSINLDSFRPMVEISKKEGVKRFIYASSSSVYGVKQESNVHEDMKLEPLTDYSLFKMKCEQILLEFQTEDFTTITIRPATVCGFSYRQRLDVVVNILTNYAYHKREIRVFGGSQLRPNIHITDMIETYLTLIEAPKLIVAGEIFNVGYENHSVLQLAETVRDVIGSDINIKQSPTDDNRSYHISSKKIEDILGFSANHSIKEAVFDLKRAFEKNILRNSFDNEKYFNIKRMQSINLK